MDGTHLAFLGLPGGSEWIVIGLIALLLFGRRLPDVARSVGRSIIEFKKGLRDVKDGIEDDARVDSQPRPRLNHDAADSLPKSSGTAREADQRESTREPAAHD
jgi:sec-independent protein translocase protein TatA